MRLREWWKIGKFFFGKFLFVLALFTRERCNVYFYWCIIVISFSVLSLNFSRILKDCRREKKCKINNSNVK